MGAVLEYLNSGADPNGRKHADCCEYQQRITAEREPRRRHRGQALHDPTDSDDDDTGHGVQQNPSTPALPLHAAAGPQAAPRVGQKRNGQAMYLHQYHMNPEHTEGCYPRVTRRNKKGWSGRGYAKEQGTSERVETSPYPTQLQALLNLQLMLGEWPLKIVQRDYTIKLPDNCVDEGGELDMDAVLEYLNADPNGRKHSECYDYQLSMFLAAPSRPERAR